MIHDDPTPKSCRCRLWWLSSANIAVIAGLVGVVSAIMYVAARPPAVVPDKIELKFWAGWVGSDLETIQRYVNEFNAAHPEYYVNTATIAGSYEKMKISFAGGDAPDICATVWTHELADYALRGALTPLDDFITSSGVKPEDYYPGIWDTYKVDGKVYALSMSMIPTFIMYNKQIFREVGLDAENPPKTLAEFDAAADRCTKFRNNDPKGEIERLGYPYDSCLYWNVAFGTPFWDEATRKVRFNAPQALAEMKWQKANVDKIGYMRLMAFRGTFGNTASPSNPFLSGKVAMITVGDWYRSIIEEYDPHGKLDYGWFAMPQPPGGKAKSSQFAASMYVIPSTCEHKEIAWEFIRFMTSARVSEGAHVGESPGNLPALRESASKPKFQDPYWQFVSELYASPNAGGPPKMPLFDFYIKQMERAEEFVMSGTKTPEQAAMEIERDVQAEVDVVYAGIDKRLAAESEQ